MKSKIGLIDVDGHRYPNLALMKLSAYHKSLGDEVEWWQSNHFYYKVYMSKVFSDTYTKDKPIPSNAMQVIRGGTGYAIKLEGDKEVYHPELDPPLSEEIEHMYPDYSLYPQYTGWGLPLKKQTAYGFLTRGCPRACEFCHVVPKEGRCSHKVADLSEFWNGQGLIRLSDPNILACKDAPELLDQLQTSKARVDFNQGLDARLITPDIAKRMASMKLKDLHFAMDTVASIEPVSRGLRLYTEAYRQAGKKWHPPRASVFILTNFGTTFQQDMMRIELIKELEYTPYVMIYNKPTAPKIYWRLQEWTNNIWFFKKYSDFFDFQSHTYKEVIYP